MLSRYVLLAGISSLAAASFVPAPTDLITKEGYAGVSVRYKEVPAGICELDLTVKSYSGYADVEDDQHIFFWFFETRNGDPRDAPLTVWINGGPGSSSMIGLWQELGPCGVNSDGDVYNNPYSWTNASNFLFIDQPTTVGFSYSKPVSAYLPDPDGEPVTLPEGTCPDYAAATESCGTYSYPNATLTANTTANAAPNFWKTIQGFMGAFPDYSRNGFHFTTESYGGHYGPVFSEYFETQNAANIPGAHNISLETVAIGNGWFDPLIQYQAYYHYLTSPGNPYSLHPYNASTQHQVYNSLYGAGNCVDRTLDCYATGSNQVCATADTLCAAQVESVFDVVANRDEYDIRELIPDPFPYSFFEDYLNTPKVQKAIGAFTNYSSFSPIVGDAFGNTGDDDRESDTIESIRKLLSQNVSVALYAGDADYNCNYLGNEAVATEIDAPGYSKAGYADVRISDGKVHGVVKQAGKFSFTRVYNAGHEVPFYQPRASLELFERFIGRRDVATGRIVAGDSYVSVGPETSVYKEGPSTIQLKVVDGDAIYNTTTNAPNPPSKSAGRLSKRDAFRTEKPLRKMSVKNAGRRRAMGRKSKRAAFAGKMV